MIFAKQALLPQGWAQDVRVTLSTGRIASVQVGSVAEPGDTRVAALLPALSNLHSHAFQRAMAGMTEHRASGPDSFWTWRRLMYRFLDRLTPGQIEAIAALVFMEMQEAGFAGVGEFHYVHHQPGGLPYNDPAELSVRIFAAARRTGIGLTHLPVFYAYGGAGAKPLSGGQQRFGCTVNSFGPLFTAIRDAARDMPFDTTLGLAPHSLRAVTPATLAEVLPLGAGGPIHMHLAEQQQEVTEIVDWLGARPVEWILHNAPVGPDWCGIHVTHMTDAEITGLAKSGAVAGLCPITEGNLGDGIFAGPDWLLAGGAFGIGSDSNVRIALGEELRQLEYSQRLRDRARNVMILGEGSVGQSLYERAAQGSAQALGRDAGRIAVGELADLVALDTDHPALAGLRPGQLLDGLIFAAGDGTVTDLWSAGRHQVKEGRHIARDAILRDWRNIIGPLREAL